MGLGIEIAPEWPWLTLHRVPPFVLLLLGRVALQDSPKPRTSTNKHDGSCLRCTALGSPANSDSSGDRHPRFPSTPRCTTRLNRHQPPGVHAQNSTLRAASSVRRGPGWSKYSWKDGANVRCGLRLDTLFRDFTPSKGAQICLQAFLLFAAARLEDAHSPTVDITRARVTLDVLPLY